MRDFYQCRNKSICIRLDVGYLRQFVWKVLVTTLKPASIFNSDRSSRCHNVCPCGTKYSRAVNLHLSRSESTQRAQLTMSLKIRVIQSKPRINSSCCYCKSLCFRMCRDWLRLHQGGVEALVRDAGEPPETHRQVAHSQEHNMWAMNIWWSSTSFFSGGKTYHANADTLIEFVLFFQLKSQVGWSVLFQSEETFLRPCRLTPVTLDTKYSNWRKTNPWTTGKNWIILSAL